MYYVHKFKQMWTNVTKEKTGWTKVRKYKKMEANENNYRQIVNKYKNM